MSLENFSGYHPDRKEAKPSGGVALTYPGQGTQVVGMGKKLVEVSRFARRTYRKADRALGYSISKISFDGPQELLDQTVHAQPAILIFNYICGKLLKKQDPDLWNKKMLAGHSFGEYNALIEAGALSFKQTVKLVKERGKHMKEACQKNPGGMIAVALGETDNRLDELKNLGMEISVINNHEQTVLSGTEDSIKKAMAWMETNGITGSRLNVEGGFHSSLMEPAVEAFSKALEKVEIKHAKVPIVGNTTATLIQTPEEIKKELIDHLTHPVLWEKSLILMAKEGIDQTVEVGEKGVLSKMIQKTHGGKTERLKRYVKGVAIHCIIWRKKSLVAPHVT